MEETMMRLPAYYNALSEDEMTYTSGGAASYEVAYLVGSIIGLSIRVYNFAWGISKSQEWVRNNKTDSITQTAKKAINDFTEDMSKGFWNAVRDVYTAYNLVTLWPITLVMLAIA